MQLHSNEIRIRLDEITFDKLPPGIKPLTPNSVGLPLRRDGLEGCHFATVWKIDSQAGAKSTLRLRDVKVEILRLRVEKMVGFALF